MRLALQRLSKRLVWTTSIIRDDDDGNAIDGSAIQPRFPLFSSRVIGASVVGETQESTRRGVRRVEGEGKSSVSSGRKAHSSCTTIHRVGTMNEKGANN